MVGIDAANYALPSVAPPTKPKLVLAGCDLHCEGASMANLDLFAVFDLLPPRGSRSPIFSRQQTQRLHSILARSNSSALVLP